MTTVIETPRNDVPIVNDATLLQVPNMNDEKGRSEYLQKIRAMRNPQPSEKVDSGNNEVSNTEIIQPETVEDNSVVESSQDAIVEPSNDVKNKYRLSKDDLKEYEIPVTDEDGNITYLSYEEFEKTVGMYSKQNKRARELAEREKEVENLKTKLISEQSTILQQSNNIESKIGERYKWVLDSLEFAHKNQIDTIKFEDGSTRKVTQLIAEKTSLEKQYNTIQQQKQIAVQKIQEAQQEFLSKQDQVLEERAPQLKKNRQTMSKFLETMGFTSEESTALVHGKAELLMLIDKAMKYENAQNSTSKEKKIGSNTKVIKHASRLAGRGTMVNTNVSSRMQELQSKGTRASADELRELRKLQLQNR